MRVGIYGRKVGMTQIFDESGAIVPITVIDTSDAVVTQVKTKDHDGYNAVQVGIGKRKPQNMSKSMSGHTKKASAGNVARVKEMRFDEGDDLANVKAGTKLSPAMFVKGDRVDVHGVSRGRGFTGVFKRFNFHGKHATHGTSKYFRHGGSNGSNTFPGRVIKNKGMPGHSGATKTTVANLLVVDVRAEENLIFLRGAVPGARNGTILIRSTKRRPAPEGRALVN